MISIIKANKKDYKSISGIGKVSVYEAHEGSCAPEDLGEYIENNYNENAIKKELIDENNIYHILYYSGEAVGFSKIKLNAKHPNISLENVVKLDRIYLLKEFQGLKLGFELLNYNITFAKNNQQNAIWLATWIGNLKAIKFYEKIGFKIIGKNEFYINKTTSNLIYQMLLNLE